MECKASRKRRSCLLFRFLSRISTWYHIYHILSLITYSNCLDIGQNSYHWLHYWRFWSRLIKVDKVAFLVVNHVIQLYVSSHLCFYGFKFQPFLPRHEEWHSLHLLHQRHQHYPKNFPPQVGILQLWFFYFCNYRRFLFYTISLVYCHQPRWWLGHCPPGVRRCLILNRPWSYSNKEAKFFICFLSCRKPHCNNSSLIWIVDHNWFSHHNVEVCFGDVFNDRFLGYWQCFCRRRGLYKYLVSRF